MPTHPPRNSVLNRFHAFTKLNILDKGSSFSRAEGLFIFLLLLGGFIYHWNPLHWGPAYIGNNQYGDAEFWWNGAIHFANGIFANNPGRGFRPGYFILTGLSLATLGTRFIIFHKYFLTVFLGAAVFLYIHLRELLGKVGAALGILLLVLNPFTAEWVATSTTDATGLVLHLISLACLISGTRKGQLDLRYLAGFAFFFSLGTLTRPLLTPFLGVVLLAIFLWANEPLKKRVQALITIILLFMLPSLGWMAIQRVTIGEWSVSSNDASMFYSASDPAIQVWNNEMYDHVANSAKSKLHLQNVNSTQINQEFWSLTVENYKKYWRYHFKRILPHFWAYAKFTPQISSHPKWDIAPIVMGFFLIFLLIQFIQYRNWKGIAFIILISSVFLLTKKGPALIIMASVCFTIVHLFKRRRSEQLSHLFLATYWVTGVAALALVGGTWGPASGHSPVEINALGYRLGAQFVFAGDLLTLLLFYKASQYFQKYNQRKINPSKTLEYWTIPNKGSNLAFGIVLNSILIFCLTVMTIGAGVVGTRYFSRSMSREMPYPSLEPFRKKYSANGYLTPVDEVYTGAASDFIWNLQGQDRTQILYYSQTKTFPFEMHPSRRIIEFPVQLDENQWRYRQGIYVLRDIKDLPPISNLAYYVNETIVRGFVPLSEDKSSFDLDHTIWFPISKYASRLAASGELKYDPTYLKWNGDSGPLPFKRRFLLKPSQTNHSVRLSLDVTHGRGNRFLKFDWLPESNSSNHSVEPVLLQIQIHRFNAKSDPIPPVNHTQSEKVGNEKIDLNDSSIKSVDLQFNNVPPDGIHVYEFNLIADQFI